MWPGGCRASGGGGCSMGRAARAGAELAAGRAGLAELQVSTGLQELCKSTPCSTDSLFHL